MNIVQTAYYYLRQQKQLDPIGLHPYACVCLVKTDTDDIARGISVCSNKDTFSKRVGRKKAYGYAIKALNSNEDTFKRSEFANDINCTILNSLNYANSYPQSMVLVKNGKTLKNDFPFTEFENSVLNG